MQSPDSDVVEETEATGHRVRLQTVGASVVARRSDAAERIAVRAVNHCVNRRDDGTRRAKSGLQGASGEGGVGLVRVLDLLVRLQLHELLHLRRERHGSIRLRNDLLIVCVHRDS